jgi:hypothetical protein
MGRIIPKAMSLCGVIACQVRIIYKSLVGRM